MLDFHRQTVRPIPWVLDLSFVQLNIVIVWRMERWLYCEGKTLGGDNFSYYFFYFPILSQQTIFLFNINSSIPNIFFSVQAGNLMLALNN